jgi:hypothetical protein
MLNVNNTILVVIDVQGKLAQIMHDKETLFANLTGTEMALFELLRIAEGLQFKQIAKSYHCIKEDYNAGRTS